MDTMKKRIYVADDFDNIRQVVKTFLSSDGYDVEDFQTGDLLLERFDDTGDYYWRYSEDDTAEYPDAKGVSLTMWAKAEDGDERACFRQFWYSADYQE